MTAQLYQFLAQYGYHHPLHPVLTHLPIGLILAGFVFILISYAFGRSDYAQTARHCIVLAMIAAIPTAIMGYLDWHHFYAGADILAVKIKIALALGLLVLLALTIFRGRRPGKATMLRVAMHLWVVLAVAGLGFFGAELVYGKKSSASTPSVSPQTEQNQTMAESVAAGQALFNQKCSFCHFTDSTDTKVGPGLKGLFQRKKMTGSGWPVIPENVAKQLMTPFEQMPTFDNLTDNEIQNLIDYLKSL